MPQLKLCMCSLISAINVCGNGVFATFSNKLFSNNTIAYATILSLWVGIHIILGSCTPFSI